MPKAGKYNFPNIDIDFVAEKLGKYHKAVQTDATKREVVAQTLGMVMTGGRFTSLIAAMDKYGLVETGGKTITITDLGKTIVYGNETERDEARRQAVSNIDLFRDLHDRYGKELKLEQIRAFLLQTANVDISKAQKTALQIDTIYKKVSKYITTAEKLAPPHETTPMVPSLGRGEKSLQRETDKSKLLKIQFGDYYLQVPEEGAKDALILVAQKLGINLREEKESDGEKG